MDAPTTDANRTLIHLVRHGEVNNPDSVIYGRMEGFGLSARGHAMADRLVGRLAGRDITRVVTSPLLRARQTAAPLAQHLGLPVRVDDLLTEARSAFEGRRMTMNLASLIRPSVWSALYNPFRPSWGEPYIDVANRMNTALHHLRDAALGHEAVAVSHQMPIWTLRRASQGQRLWHNPRNRQCDLASITTFRFEGTYLTDIDYQPDQGASTHRRIGTAVTEQLRAGTERQPDRPPAAPV